jgi:hypothetical protein
MIQSRALGTSAQAPALLYCAPVVSLVVLRGKPISMNKNLAAIYGGDEQQRKEEREHMGE